ncbi:hypothetical protein Tco_1030599 [Tanacetum coccineum]|uniref:Reverse transcriptase domain-containing protein n=1 Tax=Tanacetum coccineum TaxID=301880 RepID=A0ABQ5G7U1_9ASTR
MMAESNEYISVTRKNFLADDNKGRMVEKSFLEIQGTFLVKIHVNTFNGIIGENAFKHIDNFLEVVGPLKIKGLSQDRFRLSVFPISLAGVVSEWFKKDCIGSVTTWGNLVEKFIQKFYQLSDDHEEIETNEDDDPDDIAEIFKIKDNLFDFETPFTYKEYELNNNITGELEEPWSDNGVNAHENAPFARWENYGQGPYANNKSKKDYDPYLDNNRIFGKDYKANNIGDTQDTKKEHHDLSICNIRRFKMVKYSLKDDEEYVACHTPTMAETQERNIMINHNIRYNIEKTTMHKLQVLQRPSTSNNLE